MLFATHIYSKNNDETYDEIIGPWIVAVSFEEAQIYCDMFLEEYKVSKDILCLFTDDIPGIPFNQIWN